MPEADVGATDKKNALLRKRAAAAACTLLGAVPVVRAAQTAETAAEPEPWSTDTSFLYYSESQRMTIMEPQFDVQRNFSDDRSLNILVTVDTISGSTPIGTLPLTPDTAPHTITSASGRVTNPSIGLIPTTTFNNTRYAVAPTWQQPLGSAYTGILGGEASKEDDFLSLGGNASITRDFNQKDTTLSLGVSPEYDIGTPNGGVPVALATENTPSSIQGTRDTKNLVSALAGITQVINRQTLMQWNYSYTHEDGYLNDPYKLLSIVDPQTGDPLSAVYESRPGTRNEHSFYWLTRYALLDQDVFSLSFRYYTDDWGIRSQTLDFTYRWQSNDHRYWEPHVRYYHQSAADFYDIGLISGQPLPQYASSDLRLADFDGITFGLRFGYTFRDASQLVIRAEYYTQTGESYPNSAVGIQRSFDLFPTLYATILQIEYQFDPGKLFKRRKSPFQ